MKTFENLRSYMGWPLTHCSRPFVARRTKPGCNLRTSSRRRDAASSCSVSEANWHKRDNAVRANRVVEGETTVISHRSRTGYAPPENEGQQRQDQKYEK